MQVSPARPVWQALPTLKQGQPVWLVGDAGHNEGWIKHRALYERRVRRFFDRALFDRGPGLPHGILGDATELATEAAPAHGARPVANVPVGVAIAVTR